MLLPCTLQVSRPPSSPVAGYSSGMKLLLHSTRQALRRSPTSSVRASHVSGRSCIGGGVGTAIELTLLCAPWTSSSSLSSSFLSCSLRLPEASFIFLTSQQTLASSTRAPATVQSGHCCNAGRNMPRLRSSSCITRVVCSSRYALRCRIRSSAAVSLW